jgi:hypothetical protein
MACRTLKKNAFIKNRSKFSVNHLGNYIPKCNCFPIKVNSPHLCLPNCYFPYLPDDKKSTTIPQIMDSFFKGKRNKPKKPVFIIGYGPPASGKGSIIKMLSRLRPELNIVEKNTINGGLVDKIIQDTHQWNQAKTNIKKLCKTKKKHIEYNQKLYSTFRYFADQISDQILYKAAAERWNIYWETTGWNNDYVIHFSHMMKKMGYKTICVYPYVYEKDILDRAKQRAIKEGQTPKPDSGIITVIGKSLHNLLKLRKHVDEIIFVNNNNKKHKEEIVFTINKKKTKCNKCPKQIYKSILSKKAPLLIKELKKCC